MNIPQIGTKLKNAYFAIVSRLQNSLIQLYITCKNRWNDLRARLSVPLSVKVYWVALILSVVATVYLLIFPTTVLALTLLAIPPIAVILREHMSEREKLIWVCISILLVVSVNRGLRADQREQVAAQQKSADSFERISNQLGNATTKLGEIAALEHETLTTTVSGLKDTMDTVTGGDSFCYVVATFDQVTNEVFFGLATRGKSPLHDIEIQLVDIDAELKIFPPGGRAPFSSDLQQRMQKFLTPYPTVPFLSSTSTRGLSQMSLAGLDKRHLRFNFFAMNGNWTEQLVMRRVNGSWEQAFMVYKEINHKSEKVFEYIAPDYPQREGIPDWLA
jgi:hypothetical protein